MASCGLASANASRFLARGAISCPCGRRTAGITIAGDELPDATRAVDWARFPVRVADHCGGGNLAAHVGELARVAARRASVQLVTSIIKLLAIRRCHRASRVWRLVDSRGANSAADPQRDHSRLPVRRALSASRSTRMLGLESATVPADAVENPCAHCADCDNGWHRAECGREHHRDLRGGADVACRRASPPRRLRSPTSSRYRGVTVAGGFVAVCARW